MRTIIYILLIAIITIVVQALGVLPWWSYLVFTAIFGVIMPFKGIKISSFFCGFWAGASVWIGATLFFQAKLEGDMIPIFADIFSINSEVLLLVIGFIGGLLTGLSVYTGALFRKGKVKPELIIND